MVDFDYWWDNLTAAAQLISSEDALKRKWVQGESGITSAYSPIELLEQLLGDLHLEDCVARFHAELEQRGAVVPLEHLTRALLVLEEKVKDNPGLPDPLGLLSSPEWRDVRDAGRSLTSIASPDF